MKQQWTAQELIDHWTFTQEEIALVQNIGQTDYNRLGYGLLLKYFQREGKFPQRKQDIPAAIVGHIAQQLHIRVSGSVKLSVALISCKKSGAKSVLLT